MKGFTKITDKICWYISYISMAMIAFIMCFICADIFMRYAFNKPMNGGYEITTLVMTALIFTSWPYTQTQHGHIHVTMFIGMMPNTLRFILYSFTSLLSTAVLIIATVAEFQYMVLTITSLKTSTALLFIPYWPFQLIEAVSFGLFAIILGRDAIKSVLAIFNKQYAEEVMAYWT